MNKNITEFGILKSSKDGFRYECKMCKNEISKQDRLKNKNPKKTKWSYNKIMIVCLECGNNHTGNFHPLKKFCSKVCKNKNKNNRDYVKDLKKKYIINNPDKRKKTSINSKNKNWNNPNNIKSRKNYSLQLNVRLKNALRARIRKCLKQNSMSDNTMSIVGCTLDELKKHIENQFTEKMSWNNWNQFGWHLDHKYPLSKAKTEEEYFNLCHYTNLQPLWWEENLSKSNKLPEEWLND
jgi:hypothetical protein